MFTGATYTDLNAVMPAKLILLFISIICAAAFFVAVFRRNLQLPAIATVLLVLSSVLVGAAWPQVLQQFVGRARTPTSARRSSIERNIAATRQAFGLTDDKVTRGALQRARRRRRPAEVARRHAPRCRTSGCSTRASSARRSPSSSSGGTFYGFPDNLDIDRYTVDGKTAGLHRRRCASSNSSGPGRQPDRLDQPAPGLHARQRHRGGPGQPGERRAARTAAARAGCPSSPASTPATRRVRDPGGAAGRRAADLLRRADRRTTRSSAPRRARRRGSTTPTPQSYTYTGQGGVPLGNIVNRLVFSLLYGERNILFNGSINDNSKIMYVRDPRGPGAGGRAVADRRTATRTRPWSTAGSPGSSTATPRWRTTRTRSSMSLGEATADALQAQCRGSTRPGRSATCATR